MKIPIYCPCCGEVSEVEFAGEYLYPEPWEPQFECPECEEQFRLEFVAVARKGTNEVVLFD